MNKLTPGRIKIAENWLKAYVNSEIGETLQEALKAQDKVVEVVTRQKISAAIEQSIAEIVRQKPHAEMKQVATLVIVELLALFKNGLKIIP